MSMTPENTTRSWRDVADQLTPEQIEQLEERERDPGSTACLTGKPEHRWDDDNLLDCARHYSRNNLAAAMIDDVPAPAGAVKVYGWEDPDSPDAFRPFEIACHKVGVGIEVELRGTQDLDGSVAHEIRVQTPEVLTAESARELAATLVETADEIDRLAAR